MDGFLELMLSVNVFFQSLGEWLKLPMLALSFLGSEEFYLLFGPALYWCFDAVIGLHVALYLNISIPLNTALKFFLHGPRPFWVSTKIIPYAGEGSFGVPSGHAMNSATIFGVVGKLAQKTWALWGAAILVVLIGISRIYLGVHFLHDVLLGWILGLGLLWALFSLEPFVLRWLKTINFWAQVGAAFLGSMLLLAPAVIAQWSAGGWSMPELWAQTALQAIPDLELAPMSLEGTLSSVGAFFGLAVGGLWIQRQGGFKVEGSIWQRIARYVVGVIVILALWRGLGLLQPETQDLIAYKIRYLRYAVTGFWITGLAPVVFRKLKI